MVVDHEHPDRHPCSPCSTPASPRLAPCATQAQADATGVRHCRPEEHGSLSRHGGESGIRTHGRFDPSPVFKTGALNRSAISPKLLPALRRLRAVFAGVTSGWAAVPCGLRPTGQTGALNRSAISPELLPARRRLRAVFAG